MNFLNVYCNRIYIQNKNYSLSALLLLHTNFEKKQNLISEKCVQYFTQQRSFYTLLFFLFIQPHLLLLFFFRFFVYCCAFILFFPMFFLYFSKHFLYI